MDLPTPFRWHGDHIAADLPGGSVLFTTRRGGVSEGPFASLNLGRLTDDDGANVDAQPRAPRRGGRPAARALPLRPPGPRGDGAARDRAAGAGAARRRGGRAGDGARETPPRWCSSPTACRSRSSPTAPSRCCTAAGAGSRPAIVAEGVAALRELGAPRAGRAPRSGPARARLLLRGRRGGPRALRRLRRAGRRAQPRPRRRRARRSCGRRAWRSPRRRAVHDVRGPGAVLLPPPRRAASRAARRGSRGGPDHGVEVERARQLDGCATRSPRRRGARAATRPRSSCSRRSSTSPLEELGALAEAGVTLAGREPRAGARGQGRSALPAPSAGTSSASSRAARSSRCCRTCELIHSVASDSALRAARAPRHAGDASPRRGQRRRRGGQGRRRARRARRLPRRAARSGRRA